MKDAINPDYYKEYPDETIVMMEKLYGLEAVYNHCICNAFKYRMRLGGKDDLKQELDKEEWYLSKAAELTKRMKK